VKILIIEDEAALAKSISDYLSEENYSYDCILLDLMLPDGSGMDILEMLKKQGKEEGLIIISAKDALDDKIKALQIGADDYLTKPFHLQELAARIFSIIRRKQFGNNNIIQQNELYIDLLAKTILINENPITLTKKEFDLLIYFIGNKNKVISKSTLAEHLSGDFADMLDNHDFIYAHIKNLKKKLSEGGCGNYLKTVYGTGYRWEA